MIPLVDLVRRHKARASLFQKTFSRHLRTGDYILGKDVERFERALARYLRSPYAVGVSNGTDAIILALAALGIGPGDEVIVPALTFVSTAFAVLNRGAIPVFADVEPETLTLDPDLWKEAITPKTKAVIPVHLYGMPARMDAILETATKKHIAVIEDAAQALGSAYKGKYAGTMGTLGCFSFYPAKNLGALGDAGAVVTASKSLYQAVHLASNLGSEHKYIHRSFGGNHRLDTLQASFLHAELPFLSRWNLRRNTIADEYRRLLQGLPITLPSTVSDRTTNYHLFVIRTKRRTALQKHLARHGIQTGIHYPLPLHLQPALQSLGYKKWAFPVSERAAREVLSLPMFPELTHTEIVYIASAVRSFFS